MSIVTVTDLERGQATEIARLNQCIKFEQNLLERVGTHSPGCWAWGPGHWGCAVHEIKRLQGLLLATGVE